MLDVNTRLEAKLVVDNDANAWQKGKQSDNLQWLGKALQALMQVPEAMKVDEGSQRQIGSGKNTNVISRNQHRTTSSGQCDRASKPGIAGVDG